MDNFTDERIAECKARCEGDRDLYHAAYTDLPDALDALVEARRERDELQRRVMVGVEKILELQLTDSQNKLELLQAEAQRDEAEALLKHVYEYCKCEGSGKFQATPDALHYLAGVTDVLLHERGILENSNES